ncbi:MAG: hypothetical protein LC732_08155, partial [Acidobacteria bacterium]|nr:hypothetical protein [Acidobacteriota bacterium]
MSFLSGSNLKLQADSTAERPDGIAAPNSLSVRSEVAIEILVALFYWLVAMVALWPLPRFMGSAVSDPGDPYINVWVLDWVQYAIANRQSLFHANVFHPSPWSLTFTENLIGLAVPLMPLRLFGISPVTLHNLGVLAGFAVSGWCAYLLARSIGVARSSALISGLAFALLPWRFVQLPHVQHLQTTWLVLIPAAWFLYRRKPNWVRAFGIGIVLLLNSLTNMHFAVFGAVGLAIGAAADSLADRRLSWREISRAAAATALCMLPLYPLFDAYSRSQEIYGGRTDVAETRAFSARPSDWIPGQGGNDATRLDARQERKLFPGWALALLGIAGLATKAPKGVKAFLMSWVILGAVLSFGVHLIPYRWAFEAFSPIAGIRAPVRWSVLAYVGLAGLAAIAANQIVRLKRPAVTALAGAVIATLIIVSIPVRLPIRWFRIPSPEPAFVTWLSQPEVSGVVFEIPPGASFEYESMLHAATHHQRIVNGISGYTPPSYKQLQSQMDRDPITDDVLQSLEAWDVAFVVVHADRLGPGKAAVQQWLTRGLRAGRLLFVDRFDSGLSGDFVFAIAKNDPLGDWRRSGTESSQDLEAWLGGRDVFGSTGPFGFLSAPPPGDTVHGPLTVEGWALSADSETEVVVCVANQR